MHGLTTPSIFHLNLKMAAIVCHGQSSLDSHHHLIHTHRLRKPPLTPSHQSSSIHLSYFEQTPNHHKTTPQNNTVSYSPSNSNSCKGCWGFVPSSSIYETETAPYVHPQVKLSSVRMSPKSLELCTENLGNESGTDIMVDSGIHVFTSSEQSTSSTQCFGANKKKIKKKKIAKTKSFPPPLTTMRGSESIQVKPHREGGRLVIELTKAPSTSSSSCFHAQRSHGRLRLSLLKYPTASFDHQEEEEEEEEFPGEVEDEEETEEMEEEEEGDKRRGVIIEREKKRRSSCKEEGDHENIIRNWEWGESIWVATS